jgi:IPT/TIG domain
MAKKNKDSSTSSEILAMIELLEDEKIKQLLRKVINYMATLDDNVNAILTAVNTLVANQSTSGNAAILAAITGVQNTSNKILAQELPTPSPLVPSITSISPNNGSVTGGTTVVVTGTNFTGATGVMFGLVAGNSLVVTSDTSLTVISPAQTAGAVDIQVVDAAGTSAIVPSAQYTYS